MDPGRRSEGERQANENIPSDQPDGWSLQVGTGRAIAHHGELLQGVFEANGRLHRGLMTLPMAAQQAQATFWPRQGGDIRVRPNDRIKAARAAALTLQFLGLQSGGDLTIESSIPVGHGYGSSTADVIASIRAAAAAAGASLRRATVSRLAINAELASDAIAYDDRPVLFAHREGFVIEHFDGEYPPLIVIGFRAGTGRPVDTLRLPRARYTGEETEQFRVLRGLASRGIEQQDCRLLGRVATISALISQGHFRKPRFNAILDLAEEHGACGVQVAHSGTAVGILFDAQAHRVLKRATMIADRLTHAGFHGVTRFAVNGEQGALS